MKKIVGIDKVIVGIDEVGRGPLAGPVTVCVTVCEENVYKILKKDKNLPKSGKDSKKLKAEDREKYEKILKQLAKEKKIYFSVCHVSNRLIDTKGISFCIKKALSNGLIKLKVSKTSQILLDGGLKAPAEFKNQKTIIKGDEKEKIIAWASILAKVSRDLLMKNSIKKYPNYGFEVHKGYGTLRHRENIKKYGISPLHRKTYVKT